MMKKHSEEVKCADCLGLFDILPEEKGRKLCDLCDFKAFNNWMDKVMPDNYARI